MFRRRRILAPSRRVRAVALPAICAAIVAAPSGVLALSCEELAGIKQVSSTFSYVFGAGSRPQYVQITILAQAAERQAVAAETDPDLRRRLGEEASGVAASLAAIARLGGVARRRGPEVAAEAARDGEIGLSADALSAAIGRLCAPERKDRPSEDLRRGGLDANDAQIDKTPIGATQGVSPELGEALRDPGARTIASNLNADRGSAGAPGFGGSDGSALVATLRYASPFLVLALVFVALTGLKKLYDVVYASLHSRRWCVIPAELCFDGYTLDGRITIIGMRGFRFAPTPSETDDLVSVITADHFCGVAKIGPFDFEVVFEARSPARCVCYFVEPLTSEVVETLLALSLARPSICTIPPPRRSRARAKELIEARKAHLGAA